MDRRKKTAGENMWTKSHNAYCRGNPNSFFTFSSFAGWLAGWRVREATGWWKMTSIKNVQLTFFVWTLEKFVTNSSYFSVCRA
jgi:LPS sulfotransferase NodH